MSTAATLGVAAGIALAAWLLLLAAFAVATRARDPRPAPATMDLPDQTPPAVVNLLTNGWAVGREAVPATLLDLAARKVVTIEEIGPERFVVRVPRSEPSGLTHRGRATPVTDPLGPGGAPLSDAPSTPDLLSVWGRPYAYVR